MKMKWDEFASLLSGLSADTPLGRIIQIRSEDNPDRLKLFNSDQMRIRNEWRKRTASKISKEEMTAFLEQMKNAFIDLAE